ncbi:hypothetical protein GF324_06585 [bacterium]|nr:hypothetical protein [bacterium]
MARTFLVFAAMVILLPAAATVGFAQSPMDLPPPGGTSLGERAEEALMAGYNEQAAELFARWLEAAPGDQAAWYNYACALSRLERVKTAVRAFDYAVTAGYRDLEWPIQDPDLQNIRSAEETSEEFSAVIKRIESLIEMEKTEQAQEGGPIYVDHRTLSPYRLIAPRGPKVTGRRYPLIVLLHGRGGDFRDMQDLVDRLALPGVYYALPRAPYPVNDGVGFEYWPREAAMQSDTPTIETSRKYMTELITGIVRDAQVRAPVDSNRVLIVGFSQGAAAAFVCAMERPDLFAGLGSLAGYIPTVYAVERYFERLAEGKVACFIGHGHNDVTVQFERARKLADTLQQNGIPVNLTSYPAGHEIPDEMVVNLGEWILQRTRDADQ